VLASQECPLEENQPLSRETHAPSSSPSAFGRFRVVHQVGAGVLGPVFRAYDPDTERTVALKSFPLDLTPEQAQKLADALGHLATLDLGHPSLIVPTAAGVEGSTAYLVEDYFVADSVDIALRQYGPAPVPDALRLIGQLAGGLDFAAAAGVHHGALHPRDVLVAPRDVRLTGIGVAEAVELAGFRMPPRRPYSAPERADNGQWGVPADVYSLAALGYELVTGRRPAASGETLIVDPQAVRAADPDALVEVFARAFSMRPDDRFPSALAFAAALKHALTGQPLESPAESERPKRGRGRSGARRAAMLPLDGPEAPAPVAASEAPPAAPAMTAAAPDVTATFEPAPPEAVEPNAPPAAEPPLERVPAVPEPPVSEPSATLLPAETADVREALLAGEPELPEPPPLTIDDLDLRQEEPEPPAVAPEPERPLGEIGGSAPTSRDEAPPRLTPAYRPPLPPPRRSSPATVLVATLALVALAVAGGYYAASRYLGGGTAAPAATPAPAAPVGDTGAPQGGAATPSLPPEPTLPVAEPPAAGATSGAPAPSGTPPSGSPAASAPPKASSASPKAESSPPRSEAAGTRASAAKPKAPARTAAAPPARRTPAVFEGSLSIVSRPPGARVFLDGHPVGTTPMTLSKVSAGSHVVRLQSDGYLTWSAAIQVAAAQQNYVRASLDRPPR
jgi:eukaryotic-like serine/threonine-protein kinase